MRILRVVLLAVAAWLLLPAGSALAAPQVNGVFDLPGVTTNGQLTVGPDGNVWVALANAIGMVKPDGTVKEYASADLNNQLGTPGGGITSAGGFIWVSQSPGAGQEALVKIPPANPAGATGIAVTGVTAGSSAMTTDKDGNVWVGQSGKLVKFPPANPAGATTFTTDLTGLAPKGMTVASDGTIWVTDSGNSKVYDITTSGGVTPYPIAGGGGPQFIAGGPSGQVAFSNPTSTPQQIALLSPGGTPKTIARPIPADPFGVAFGADGAYWVAMFAGNRLDRVTTDGTLTSLTGFPVVSGQGPREITAGPGNTLWTTLDNPGDSTKSKIARVTGVTAPTGGGGSTAPGDTTPPTVNGAGLSRTSLPAGTARLTLRFGLSEAGTAKVALSRRTGGRRRGKACVAPRRSLRRAPACTRLISVRTVTKAVAIGGNAIALSTRTLPAGSYRVTLTVTDAAGNRAPALTRSFTVAKRR